MRPALMIVHRGEDGMVTPMPFTYKSGEMMAVVEEIADYMAGMGLFDSLWEGIAADRLGEILRMKAERQEMADVIRRQQNIIDYARDRIGAFA